MDHQLHAAGFVEEPLEHDLVLRRQGAERSAGRGQVLDELVGGRLGQADLVHHPAESAPLLHVAPEVRRRLRPEARHRP
jgi:hypothetical protein